MTINEVADRKNMSNNFSHLGRYKNRHKCVSLFEESLYSTCFLFCISGARSHKIPHLEGCFSADSSFLREIRHSWFITVRAKSVKHLYIHCKQNPRYQSDSTGVLVFKVLKEPRYCKVKACLKQTKPIKLWCPKTQWFLLGNRFQCSSDYFSDMEKE